MKIWLTRLVICLFVLLFQGFFVEKNVLGQQQRPPLSVDPNEECHIADAVPLLIASRYKSQGYKMIEFKEKPLIIQENISPSKFVDLRIEQRGCEDVYAKFVFAFKNKADGKLGLKLNLKKAAQIIKNLKLRPEALLNREEIVQISKAVIKQSQKARPPSQLVTCLVKMPNECFSDVSVKYRFPQLEVFYITRP